MPGWIVRILFVLAAPIAALLASRDALNFCLVQTLVTIILIGPLSARRGHLPEARVEFDADQ